MHSELPTGGEILEANWNALRTAYAILGLLDCLGLELVGGNRRGGEQERWLPGRHCLQHGAELSSQSLVGLSLVGLGESSAESSAYLKLIGMHAEPAYAILLGIYLGTT